MRTALALTLAMVAWLLSATASADKVPPPPPDCLEGSTAATSHGGPYCRPNACKKDADCKGATVCRQLPLCVGTVTAGGRRWPRAPRPKYPTVLGRCNKADGSKCSLPAGAADRYWGVKKGTCQSLKICVPNATAPPATAAPSVEPSAQPTAQPSVAEPGTKAPTSSGAATPTDPPAEPPPVVDKRPPCSCAGSPGDLSPLMTVLVMLWLLARRRRLEPA